jgi:hypothetical protein
VFDSAVKDFRRMRDSANKLIDSGAVDWCVPYCSTLRGLYRMSTYLRSEKNVKEEKERCSMIFGAGAGCRNGVCKRWNVALSIQSRCKDSLTHYNACN